MRFKITKIELQNFGQHEAVEHSPTSDLIGLVGENGCGKTTFLSALALVIQGRIGKSGTGEQEQLQEYIRRADHDAPTYAQVYAEFTCDGKNGSIKYRITKSAVSRELFWDGLSPDTKQPIKAAAEVNKIMESLLGVDRTATDATVFVRQGETDAMFGTATNRRDFYLKLLSLTHLAKVSDISSGFADQVLWSIADLGPALDAAREDARLARAAFEDSEEELGRTMDMTSRKTIVSTALSAIGREKETTVVLCNTQDTALAMAGFVGPADATAAAGILSSKKSVIESELRDHREKLNTSKNAISVRTGLESELMAHQETYANLLASISKQSDRSQLEASLAAVPVLDDPTVKIDSLVKSIEGAKAAKEAVVSLQPIAGEIAQLEEELGRLEQTVNNELEGGSKMAADVKALEDSIDRRKKAAALHEHGAGTRCEACGSTDGDPDYLKKSIESDEAKLAEMRPKLAELREAYASTKVEFAKVNSTLNDVMKKASGFKTTIAANTRYMGVVLVKAEEDLASAQAQLADFKKAETERSDLRSKLSMISVQDLTALLQRKVDAEVRTKQLESKIALCKTSETITDEQVQALNSEVEKSEKLLEQLTKTVAQFDMARDQAEAAAQAAAACQTEVLSSSDLAKWIRPLNGAITAATLTQVLGELAAGQSAYDAAVATHAERRRTSTTTEDRLIDLEVKVAEQAERRNLGERLRKLQNAFAPGGFTLAYIDYMFDRIANLAADYLSAYGCNFTVRASEEAPLTFEFLRLDKPNQVWLNQRRLSGGQRNRLAIAVLRAVHEIAIPNVGFMCLDEPSTHMDNNAKQALSEMLKAIRDEGVLQLWVCDHDPILQEAFGTSVIKLQA